MKVKKLSLKKKGVKRKVINVSLQFSKKEIEVGKLILDNRFVHFKYNDEFLTLGLNILPI
jgi:hypothetical protein